MKTYSHLVIKEAVKEAAENYASFVGGIVEKSWDGYVVHGNGEFVYFTDRYAGTRRSYYPCYNFSIRYAVEVRICSGGEEVTLLL